MVRGVQCALPSWMRLCGIQDFASGLFYSQITHPSCWLFIAIPWHCMCFLLIICNISLPAEAQRHCFGHLTVVSKPSTCCSLLSHYEHYKTPTNTIKCPLCFPSTWHHLSIMMFNDRFGLMSSIIYLSFPQQTPPLAVDVQCVTL